MSTLKAILFDHDGTLVNSEKIHYQMWRGILRGYDIELGVEDYAEHYAGIPTTANAETMKMLNPALPATAAELVDAKNVATRNYLSTASFPLMAGVIETMDYFQEHNLRMAIVTGASTDGVVATIRAHKLSGYVSAVVSGDDVENSKPAPDCYLLAMRKLAIEPSECIAIEDTEHGVKAATDANIPCIAVASEMSEHHDFRQAVATLGSLDEARRWIATHFEFS